MGTSINNTAEAGGLYVNTLFRNLWNLCLLCQSAIWRFQPRPPLLLNVVLCRATRETLANQNTLSTIENAGTIVNGTITTFNNQGAMIEISNAFLSQDSKQQKCLQVLAVGIHNGLIHKILLLTRWGISLMAALRSFNTFGVKGARLLQAVVKGCKINMGGGWGRSVIALASLGGNTHTQRYIFQCVLDTTGKCAMTEILPARLGEVLSR